MIRVFVGSSERFKICEDAVTKSIFENTDECVKVQFMRPGDIGVPEQGCTGFTNMRFAVPELAGHRGFAIYLDVDMFLLADIRELWNYQQEGEWVVLQDGSTEVAVIDCAAPWAVPALSQIHLHNKNQIMSRIDFSPRIPPEWNSEDKLCPGAKLLHFTDLKTQPWWFDHPNQEAVEVWKRYA